MAVAALVEEFGVGEVPPNSFFVVSRINMKSFGVNVS